jgi:hypothetical protein
MRMMARHKINQGAINVMFRNPAGGLARDMARRGLKVETAAKRNLAGANGKPRRINNGILRNTTQARPVTWRGLPASRIGSPVRYARLVHDGTGLFGPKKRKITPKTKKALRFKPKGSARVIFARSVKGMEANPFLKDALSAARD